MLSIGKKELVMSFTVIENQSTGEGKLKKFVEVSIENTAMNVLFVKEVVVITEKKPCILSSNLLVMTPLS